MFGFPSVSVSVELTFCRTWVALNDFVTVGGVFTFRFALAATRLLPKFVFRSPTAIAFVYIAPVADVTTTVIVQPVVPGIVAPFA